MTSAPSINPPIVPIVSVLRMGFGVKNLISSISVSNLEIFAFNCFISLNNNSFVSLSLLLIISPLHSLYIIYEVLYELFHFFKKFILVKYSSTKNLFLSRTKKKAVIGLLLDSFCFIHFLVFDNYILSDRLVRNL